MERRGVLELYGVFREALQMPSWIRVSAHRLWIACISCSTHWDDLVSYSLVFPIISSIHKAPEYQFLLLTSTLSPLSYTRQTQRVDIEGLSGDRWPEFSITNLIDLFLAQTTSSVTQKVIMLMMIWRFLSSPPELLLTRNGHLIAMFTWSLHKEKQ